MKIKEIYKILNLLKESKKQLNEGFYAYHCTRAQIEEFNDAHDNKESGRGAFWGPGTYFEILDRDGNFHDYGDESSMTGYRKGKGQQYKVYVDLKPEQLLDTNKSFNDYGMSFSLEEAFDFIINSPLMFRWSVGFDYVLKKFLKLKKEHNNFNTIADKRKAYGDLIQNIDSYTDALGRLRCHNHVGRSNSLFGFESLIKSNKELMFFYDVSRYAKEAVEFLGNEDYNPDIETKIKEDVAAGYRHPAGAEALIKIIKFLGDSKKIEEKFNKYIQSFFKMVKVSLNKLPMAVFLNHRFSMKDVKWCMEKFGVYGKIVPEKGLNDNGKPRQYLILWKTTGIVKKVGERYKKSEKFTDEIEDEAQDKEIDDMLQYVGG